jgi:rSAM/selenodomain-associated transferase 1
MGDYRARVLVFAKAPVAGQVKTRLIPVLGDQGAAALHRRLVRRTLGVVSRVDGAEGVLCCAPDARHGFFRAQAARYGVRLRSQRGQDLGARMAHAMGWALAQGPGVVLIGSDCPGLTARDLSEAIAALRAGCDAVLGPALDGGYVLIGLRRYSPRVFEAVPWGSARVLDLTRARLQGLGWCWQELAPHRDLDRSQDLACFPQWVPQGLRCRLSQGGPRGLVG